MYGGDDEGDEEGDDGDEQAAEEEQQPAEIVYDEQTQALVDGEKRERLVTTLLSWWQHRCLLVATLLC